MAHEHHGRDGHEHGRHGHGHGHLHTGDGLELAVCSFTITLTAEQDGTALAKRLADAVDALCGWARQGNLLVGHIKLFAAASGESLWLSSTGDTPDARHTAGWPGVRAAPCELHFTAIVYGLTEQSLAGAVREALGLDGQ